MTFCVSVGSVRGQTDRAEPFLTSWRCLNLPSLRRHCWKVWNHILICYIYYVSALLTTATFHSVPLAFFMRLDNTLWKPSILCNFSYTYTKIGKPSIFSNLHIVDYDLFIGFVDSERNTERNVSFILKTNIHTHTHTHKMVRGNGMASSLSHAVYFIRLDHTCPVLTWTE